MPRASSILATLLLVGIAGLAQDVPSSSGEPLLAGEMRVQASMAAQLGVQVTVVEQSQLNLSPAGPDLFRGGLCVVRVTGPLARASNLRVGDTIVAIGELFVTDLATAEVALRDANESPEKTQISFLRGRKIMQAELMLEPPRDDGAVDAGVSADSPAVQELAYGVALETAYREKRDWLTQELQAVDDMERIMGAGATEDSTRMRIRLLRERVQQAAVLEGQLARLSAAMERGVEDDQVDDPDADARQHATLVDQKRIVEMQIEALSQQSTAIVEMQRHSAQVEDHQHRVRVLRQGLEKSIRDLRAAGLEGQARNKTPAP